MPMMNVKIINVGEVDSTNTYIRQCAQTEAGELLVVTADYQTAGRGQAGNTWVSNRGENLLFSVKFSPNGVPAVRQFVLSQAIALSVRDALRMYIGEVDLKWPNDIIWHEHKLGGILIECSIRSGYVTNCVMGVGIDVNQRSFEGVKGNDPISLYQITHREIDRRELLNSIIEDLKHYLHMIEEHRYDDIMLDYTHALYRRNGFHPYRDSNGLFMARIVSITPQGHLTLKDDDGMIRTYGFKEVELMKE